MQKIGISETLFKETKIDESLDFLSQIEECSASTLIKRCMTILEEYQTGIQCPADILEQVIRDCKGWSHTNLETVEL